jgi:hypothetical protein
MQNLAMREKLLNELAEFLTSMPDTPDKKPGLEGGVDGDESMPDKGVKVGMLEVEGKPGHGLGMNEAKELGDVGDDESAEGAEGEMLKKMLGKV